jgi:hypothetical protein
VEPGLSSSRQAQIMVAKHCRGLCLLLVPSKIPTLERLSAFLMCVGQVAASRHGSVLGHGEEVQVQVRVQVQAQVQDG